MTGAADEAMDEEFVVQACEPIVDYQSESGVLLFFERLHNGWFLDAAGVLRPPPSGSDSGGPTAASGKGPDHG